MKLYLAGPMRGYPQYNYNTFEQGVSYLAWLGHKVGSPHQFDIDKGLVDVDYEWTHDTPRGYRARRFTRVDLTPAFEMETVLRWDFAYICEADGIALLPGWWLSEGARKEKQVNTWVGGVELFVDPWKYATFTPPADHAQRAD